MCFTHRACQEALSLKPCAISNLDAFCVFLICVSGFMAPSPTAAAAALVTLLHLLFTPRHRKKLKIRSDPSCSGYATSRITTDDAMPWMANASGSITSHTSAFRWL